MAERTEGWFRVVIYPSGQLGGERVAFEQLQAGAQQMSISGTPVLSGWVPEGQIFDLPFLFTDRDQGLRVWNGPLGDWWRGLLLDRTGARSQLSQSPIRCVPVWNTFFGYGWQKGQGLSLTGAILHEGVGARSRKYLRGRPRRRRRIAIV